MRFSGINFESFVDGDGVRVVLFTSGCAHHCKNCHNPMTWSCDYGDEYTDDIKKRIGDRLNKSYISGLTLSGGDPLLNPKNTLAMIDGLNVKKLWIYTGYTWEEIIERCKSDINLFSLVSKASIIVDGKYIEEQKDSSLVFKGSANQRIIDVQKSLIKGAVVLDRE